MNVCLLYKKCSFIVKNAEPHSGRCQCSDTDHFWEVSLLHFRVIDELKSLCPATRSVTLKSLRRASWAWTCCLVPEPEPLLRSSCSTWLLLCNKLASVCVALIHVTFLVSVPAFLPMHPVPELQKPSLMLACFVTSASSNPLARHMNPGLPSVCSLTVDGGNTPGPLLLGWMPLWTRK